MSTRRFAETTRVPVSQSRGEIEKLLSRHRCQQFGTAVDYIALKARVQFNAHQRIVRFVVSLPDPKKFKRRLDSFIAAVASKRLTYARLTQ